MKQQMIKDLEPTYKQVLCNLTKEIEKNKKLSFENKILAEFVGLCYKEQGFSLASNQVVDNYLANVVIIDNLMQIFVNYLKEYTKKYAETFNIICENSGLETEKREIYKLNMCSDVIESMFGKYKSTISTNQLVGVSTTCLELPLCHMNMEQLTAQITPAMEAVLVADIGTWKKGQNINNQAVRRQDFFKNQQKKSSL